MNRTVIWILSCLITLIIFVILIIVSKRELDKIKADVGILRISFDELHHPIYFKERVLYLYGREETPNIIDGYTRYTPTMHLSKVVQRAPQNLFATKDTFTISPLSAIYMGAASLHTMTNGTALLRQANDLRPDYYIYGPRDLPIVVLQTLDEIVIKWLGD